MTPEGHQPRSIPATHEGSSKVRLPAMVECLHIHKTYASGPTVFQNVNVEIARGDFALLVGPGGVGKTTFLNLLLGTERPDSGTVLIDGRNVHSLRERELALFRQRMGVVFQDLKLMANRTVYDNVALPLFALARGEALIRQRVTQVLAALKLQDKRGVKCETLSESERQRTAIARAIVHSPVLLLADEPVAHLDDEDRALVVSLLEKVGMGGGTVIVTAHGTPGILGEAAARILEIHNRRLVERRAGLDRAPSRGGGASDGAAGR